MNAPQTVTVTLDTNTLLIAAATVAAACQEVLEGNAEILEPLRRKSAEAFARTADAIVTTVSEEIARQAHIAANGDWSGPPEDRPWRHASESERGQSLAVLAQGSPRAVALIRELKDVAHGR